LRLLALALRLYLYVKFLASALRLYFEALLVINSQVLALFSSQVLAFRVIIRGVGFNGFHGKRELKS
jgi:hypothetical protein